MQLNLYISGYISVQLFCTSHSYDWYGPEMFVVWTALWHFNGNIFLYKPE